MRNLLFLLWLGLDLLLIVRPLAANGTLFGLRNPGDGGRQLVTLVP